jgi:hypothetical protein
MENGLFFADCLLALLATLCALAHLAILRAPDLVESATIERVRYIKIGGCSILAIRWWIDLVLGGDILILATTEMGLTLFLGAEFYRTVYRLFQHKIDLQEERRASRQRRRAQHD